MPDFRSGMGGDLKGLRVGIISELASNANATAEASGAFEAALAVMGELGASVEEVSLPLTADLEAIKVGPLARGGGRRFIWRDSRPVMTSTGGRRGGRCCSGA